MMKDLVKITGEQCLKVYTMLKGIKLTKVSNTEDKVSICKIVQKLRPVAIQLIADKDDACIKMQGENHQEMMTKLAQWLAGLELSPIEKQDITTYVENYNKAVEEAVKELMEKVTAFNMELVSDLVIGLLLLTCDWTPEDTAQLMDIICKTK